MSLPGKCYVSLVVSIWMIRLVTGSANREMWFTSKPFIADAVELIGTCITNSAYNTDNPRIKEQWSVCFFCCCCFVFGVCVFGKPFTLMLHWQWLICVCVCTVSPRVQHKKLHDAGHNVCKIVQKKAFPKLSCIFSPTPLKCKTY